MAAETVRDGRQSYCTDVGTDGYDVGNRCDDNHKLIKTVSYNMHGYNQGCIVVRDIMLSVEPDIIMVQEHWLTPSNLDRFSAEFTGYLSFGSSAMCTAVESGILRGRPFGGVMTLVKHGFSHCTQTLCASERCVVVKVFNILVCNVYFPCTGTVDRELIIENLCIELEYWIDKYNNCDCIIGGDFNMEAGVIDTSDLAVPLKRLITHYDFEFCAPAFGHQTTATFVNESLGCRSTIDHFLVNKLHNVTDFDVLNCNVNFSDHVPIAITYRCDHVTDCLQSTALNELSSKQKALVKYLRWDYADVVSYHFYTGEQLRGILDTLMACDIQNATAEEIDGFYNNIIDVLYYHAECYVPTRSTSFFKFWWDEELDLLKNDAIYSCGIWKEAGRPRSGPIFDKYRADKQAYKRAINSHRQNEKLEYSNDLHEMLMEKQGPNFWRLWRSKFGNKNREIVQVDGVVNENIIVDKFVKHFQSVCNKSNRDESCAPPDEYVNMRKHYYGDQYLADYTFDACLVERVINDMKWGKAAGLDNLTAEHLQNCHALLHVVLAKLFNIIILTGHVPAGFGYSYTVPIPKLQSGNVVSKAVTVDDFRGISISPVISKVFEHCILARFRRYFVTNDNQFSYKRKLGCTTAVHTLRRVVDHYVQNGSTVNLCAMDLSKAFDRINHHILFTKLMRRRLPVYVLTVIEHWFAISVTCVKWHNCLSSFFNLATGTRQGGVLSPVLFNIYLDEVIAVALRSGVGCHIGIINVAILVYADDILLLAPTVSSLQLLLDICHKELDKLEMEINYKKTVCMRIGPGCKRECANITVNHSHNLRWVHQVRYLGVVIVSSTIFKCDFSNCKKAFYRAFNATFGRIGRNASTEVIMELVKKKCLPVLYYGCEVLHFNTSDYKALDYVINCAVRKIVNTRSFDVVDYCREAFGIATMKETVSTRRESFMRKLTNISHLLSTVWL